MTELQSVFALSNEMKAHATCSPLEIDGAFGAAPQLVWLAIADLVVDPAYQRPIGATGWVNIRAIATNFRWKKFSPVVVAPIEGGGFAIVDGQHRTVGAHLAGIERVPCIVQPIDRRDQAEAFLAINGRVTRMSPLALHRAAVAAGDARACAIDLAATSAGVVILAYPKMESRQAPGETMAVQAIGWLLGEAGAATARLALTIIRRSAGDRPGAILQPIIRAVGERVVDLRGDGRSVDEVEAMFSGIDLLAEYRIARAAPARPGEAVWLRVLNRLRERT